MIYLIGLKKSNKFTEIKAKSELEARVNYCKERGLMYRVFANKLEIKIKDGGKTDARQKRRV